jgi:hypothetical protein
MEPDPLGPLPIFIFDKVFPQWQALSTKFSIQTMLFACFRKVLENKKTTSGISLVSFFKEKISKVNEII